MGVSIWKTPCWSLPLDTTTGLLHVHIVNFSGPACALKGYPVQFSRNSWWTTTKEETLLFYWACFEMDTNRIFSFFGIVILMLVFRIFLPLFDLSIFPPLHSLLWEECIWLANTIKSELWEKDRELRWFRFSFTFPYFCLFLCRLFSTCPASTLPTRKPTTSWIDRWSAILFHSFSTNSPDLQLAYASACFAKV